MAFLERLLNNAVQAQTAKVNRTRTRPMCSIISLSSGHRIRCVRPISPMPLRCPVVRQLRCQVLRAWHACDAERAALEREVAELRAQCEHQVCGGGVLGGVASRSLDVEWLAGGLVSRPKVQPDGRKFALEGASRARHGRNRGVAQRRVWIIWGVRGKIDPRSTPSRAHIDPRITPHHAPIQSPASFTDAWWRYTVKAAHEVAGAERGRQRLARGHKYLGS